MFILNYKTIDYEYSISFKKLSSPVTKFMYCLMVNGFRYDCNFLLGVTFAFCRHLFAKFRII